MQTIINCRKIPQRQPSKKCRSVWLDHIRRNLITSGSPDRLMEQERLRGMTSSPAIFEKIVTGCGDYVKGPGALRSRHDLDEAARLVALPAHHGIMPGETTDQLPAGGVLACSNDCGNALAAIQQRLSCSSGTVKRQDACSGFRCTAVTFCCYPLQGADNMDHSAGS
jgi:hypothetical protein